MPATLFAKGRMGIDGNRPIDTASGTISPQVSDPAVIANTGAAFVRINFVLGPWNAPGDTTLHAGRTWFQVYDRIIDGFLNQGVEVYGLIGSEATSRPDPGDRFRMASPNPDAEDWLVEYANNFETIVDHFSGRVAVYESFNEPNDWHGGSSNWIHSYWFAKMLRVVYKKVKIDGGHDVTLVSGPLLTHDLPTGGDDGTYYLDRTYLLGRSSHAWEQFQNDYGTYPLDAIGYHLYVAEGADATPSNVEMVYNRYLDAIWGIISRYEGSLTEKGLHVSEYGWSSEHGEDKQASRMAAGFRLLRDHSRVKSASWFCTQDFPGKSYGLYRAGSLTPANRKQAYATFKALIDESAPIPRVGYDALGAFYPTILAAYNRNGGEAALGVPFDNGGGAEVHPWGNGVVQDFKTPAGQSAIITLQNGAASAYMVNGIIRHRYIYTYGGPLGPLGFPVSDVTGDEWSLPRCQFEKGEITCRTYTEFHDG
jgi:hypothetical protein